MSKCLEVWLGGHYPRWIAQVDRQFERVQSGIAIAAFEKYVPVGTPEMVAESLSQYLDLGCKLLNLKVVADSDRASIEAGAEIIERLRA